MYVNARLSVIRERAVGNGFSEQLTILNHDDEPVDLKVRIDAGCDFADLFEVKDALEKKGRRSANVEEGRLRLVYEREKFRRATEISASAPARLDERGLTFEIRIEPHAQWTTDLNVVTALLASRRGTSGQSTRARRGDLGLTRRRIWIGGWRTRRSSSVTGSPFREHIGEASSTSLRCASRR